MNHAQPVLKDYSDDSAQGNRARMVRMDVGTSEMGFSTDMTTIDQVDKGAAWERAGQEWTPGAEAEADFFWGVQPLGQLGNGDWPQIEYGNCIGRALRHGMANRSVTVWRRKEDQPPAAEAEDEPRPGPSVMLIKRLVTEAMRRASAQPEPTIEELLASDSEDEDQ